MTTESSALLTDLYQLTMVQAYVDHGLTDTASFELFVRRLPAERNFLVAAGLEQVLGFLEDFRFSEQELDWYARSRNAPPAFIDFLRALRFEGDVWAMPEGTLFFANEPILRVTAPLPVAQLVETRIINILQYQTLIASKAVRCVLAAPGRLLVEFGLRRAHGAEAGLMAARASYLAGFTGTSNVLAGMRFDIPLFGTMAHAFVQCHDREADAFLDFARSHPDNVILLIDTYDTPAAARTVVEIAPVLKQEGIDIRGVRIDSGDLLQRAREVRQILDEGGLNDTTLFSSGDLDEYRLTELLGQGAPIDGFGVGTRLDTSADEPYLNCAYKLVEYAGRPRFKSSEGKATLPGRKQVFRVYQDGQAMRDIMTLHDRSCEGTPLLQPVMRAGRRLQAEPMSALRERLKAQLDRLPPSLRTIEPAPPYPVEISEEIKQLLSRQTG